MNKKLLMIDNYDSFTYNLVQYFFELNCDVIVKRNDEITLKEIEKLSPDYIVISPGPCTPNEAGISVDIIKSLGDKFPILGVCLGHQSIAQAFGGNIIHAKQIMHGKTSLVEHDSTGLYKNIPSPLQVTRYHSLTVEQSSLPSTLKVTGWVTSDSEKEIMSFRHIEKPIFGVQYHPESILTDHGKQILENFLSLSNCGIITNELKKFNHFNA